MERAEGLTTIEVDERWIAEWVDYGMAELYRYLDRQARFSAYYNLRERTFGRERAA